MAILSLNGSLISPCAVHANRSFFTSRSGATNAISTVTGGGAACWSQAIGNLSAHERGQIPQIQIAGNPLHCMDRRRNRGLDVAADCGLAQRQKTLRWVRNFQHVLLKLPMDWTAPLSWVSSAYLGLARYPRETQEMVFDAHDKSLVFFGVACQRGNYDSMKKAVDASSLAANGAATGASSRCVVIFWSSQWPARRHRGGRRARSKARWAWCASASSRLGCGSRTMRRCSSPSATSYPRKPKHDTRRCLTTSPWWRDSKQPTFGKPWAVHPACFIASSA